MNAPSEAVFRADVDTCSLSSRFYRNDDNSCVQELRPLLPYQVQILTLISFVNETSYRIRMATTVLHRDVQLAALLQTRKEGYLQIFVEIVHFPKLM